MNALQKRMTMNHKEHKETGPFVFSVFFVVKLFVFQPKKSSVNLGFLDSEKLCGFAPLRDKVLTGMNRMEAQ
jgi:hypothetical protein